MANTYILTKSDGSILTQINEGARDNREATSLVLHGRGAAEYGLPRDNNLVWLLENFANDTPPVNPIVGQLWFDTINVEFFYCSFAGSPPTWTSIINPAAVVPPSRQVIAGAGLTGGGNLSADVTLNVGGSSSITVAADNISVNSAGVDHDTTLNFVANEHIDHTGVVLTAGAGLTGGGDISLSRTLNVGAGDGISVAADSVAVDTTVVRTSGVQTIGGVKTFTDQIIGLGSGPSAPSFTWPGTSQNTGMYLAGVDSIGFSADGTLRLQIESDGTLNVAGTVNYESLVLSDDDIPNKKYVDDAVIGGAAPTSNTFSNNPHVQEGGYWLSGLTVGKKYLVACGGTTYGKGNGLNTMQPITLKTGTTLGSGAVIDFTPTYTIDWPDGQWQTSATFIITATDADLNAAVDFNGVTWRGADWVHAVQLD